MELLQLKGQGLIGRIFGINICSTTTCKNSLCPKTSDMEMCCRIKLLLVGIFMIICTQFGYCQPEFIEIYSDDVQIISIYPGNEFGEFDSNPAFLFRREYLTPNRREAEMKATGLSTEPYIEARLVIYDANWEQCRIISMSFYDKNNEEIDSIASDTFKWYDVSSIIEILMRDRALQLYKMWEEYGTNFKNK